MTDIQYLMLYQEEPSRSGNFGMRDNRFYNNEVAVDPERKDRLFRMSLTFPNQSLAVFNNRSAKNAIFPDQACKLPPFPLRIDF